VIDVRGLVVGATFGVLIGAATAALVVLPLVASWPMRLRWLIASQAAHPLFSLPMSTGYVLSEVRLVDVRPRLDAVDVTVAEPPEPRRSRRLRTVTHPGTIAKLEGWHAIRTPLLLLVDDTGTAQLCGPDASVPGFRRIEALDAA
jgi:hypothetical protein